MGSETEAVGCRCKVNNVKYKPKLLHNIQELEIKDEGNRREMSKNDMLQRKAQRKPLILTE